MSFADNHRTRRTRADVHQTYTTVNDAVELEAPYAIERAERAHTEAAGWRLLEPPRDHPAIRDWLERGCTSGGRNAPPAAVCVPSVKAQASSFAAEVWSGDEW